MICPRCHTHDALRMRLILGDAAHHVPDLGAASVDAVITSPPYDAAGSIVALADPLRRVLTPEGTCWLLLGDPAREPVALGFVAAGWTLAAATAVGRDSLLRLHPTADTQGYFGETGTRTPRTEPVLCDRYAPLPLDLVEDCLTTSTLLGDHVLDPYCGIGTVGRVCEELGRSFCGIDLDPLRLGLARAYLARSVPRGMM